MRSDEKGKSHEFKGLEKCIALPGHKGGAHQISVSSDEKYTVTLSAENILKIWNTDVEYDNNENPKLLKEIP